MAVHSPVLCVEMDRDHFRIHFGDVLPSWPLVVRLWLVRVRIKEGETRSSASGLQFQGLRTSCWQNRASQVCSCLVELPSLSASLPASPLPAACLLQVSLGHTQCRSWEHTHEGNTASARFGTHVYVISSVRTGEVRELRSGGDHLVGSGPQPGIPRPSQMNSHLLHSQGATMETRGQITDLQREP